jgi:hypothetical protein
VFPFLSPFVVCSISIDFYGEKSNSLAALSVISGKGGKREKGRVI